VADLKAATSIWRIAALVTVREHAFARTSPDAEPEWANSNTDPGPVVVAVRISIGICGCRVIWLVVVVTLTVVARPAAIYPPSIVAATVSVTDDTYILNRILDKGRQYAIERYSSCTAE
jgi:hypothetical protein